MNVSLLAVSLASEAGEENGAHTSPYLFGLVALVIMMLLLFITTRLNMER